MPSKSPEQAALMRAAAHSPEVAKKTGVPQKVAREFVAADTRLGQRAVAPNPPKRYGK
jgi:hypothetical protein